MKKGAKRPKISRIRKKKSMSRDKRKEQPKKEDTFQVGFEEVIIRCPSCGRNFRIVKSSQFSTEGMLCQRCSAGGGIGFDEESDV